MLRVSAVKRIGGRRTVQTFARRFSPSSPSPRTLLAVRSLSHLTSTSTLGRPTANVQQKRAFHVTAPAAKRRETFKLADIGEGITECEVIKWSLPPNTRISAFEPLCEVQSDKASVEITSPFDGVVVELLVKEGEIAKVGSGLCVIEVDSDDVSGSGSSSVSNAEEKGQGVLESNANTTSLDVKVAEERQAANATTSDGGGKKRKHPLDPSNTTKDPLDLRLGSPKGKSLFGKGLDSFNDEGRLSSSGFTPSPSPSIDAKDVLATPQIRHLAKSLGVDIARVAPGSGKDGRVERGDLDAYLARVSSSQQQASSTQQQGGQGQQQQTTGSVGSAVKDEDVVVELGRTRWNMYRAMEKSLSIPHFGYTTTLDITALHALLPSLNASIPQRYLPEKERKGRVSSAVRGGMVNPYGIYGKDVQDSVLASDVDETGQYTKLTYLPILLKTLSKAMMEWPLLRSSITPPTASSASSTAGTKPTLTVRPRADIALALSTPTGLYTPTLVGAERQSVFDIASRVKRLSYLGRQIPSALTPKEMPKRGGTITVSNVGAVGAGVDASPVLVEGGGVAIVALGRARWELDVSDEYWFGHNTNNNNDNDSKVDGGNYGGGRGERRLKLPVSWSADHRVVEGAELAAFVESWRGWVERPERLVGEGV